MPLKNIKLKKENPLFPGKVLILKHSISFIGYPDEFFQEDKVYNQIILPAGEYKVKDLLGEDKVWQFKYWLKLKDSNETPFWILISNQKPLNTVFLNLFDNLKIEEKVIPLKYIKKKVGLNRVNPPIKKQKYRTSPEEMKAINDWLRDQENVQNVIGDYKILSNDELEIRLKSAAEKVEALKKVNKKCQ